MQLPLKDAQRGALVLIVDLADQAEAGLLEHATSASRKPGGQ